MPCVPLPNRVAVEQTKPAKDRRRQRLGAAIPPFREFIFGAVGWGAMMALSALLAIALRNGLLTDRLMELLVVYFFGGAFAWPFMIPLARVLAFRKSVETRFAAFFLTLSVGTMAMTAFLFAMDYRLFYSRWHAPFGSIVWMFQFVFTSASAVYQFAVLGSRLFLPLGLLFLVATSLYLAKRMR
ncbi:hypothetical protein [Rhizobium sp. BK376]|uniref:hypothetical protein n=1 Tax=Rhizobium sp. BK376 TaxID=2512149 RepID=UPI0010D7FCA4|nr:hypothetical protein [Rhizobium sp. BK376]TCR82133.1 hypothetical protein EV561_11134 [Rhizobium sp. BK376]